MVKILPSQKRIIRNPKKKQNKNVTVDRSLRRAFAWIGSDFDIAFANCFRCDAQKPLEIRVIVRVYSTYARRMSASGAARSCAG